MNRYRDWLEQGKRDLEKAKIDLKFKYYEWACFSSQQAAEKAVKSLGMKYGIELWGHSISQMLKIADYYTEKEAKEAIDAASEIIQWCESNISG